MDMDPQDRDIVTRTVMGEAGGQSDDALAAIANVIKNRVDAGGYGDTPTAVVLRRGQFEPWSIRARELQGYSVKSPEYRRAAQIVDDVFSGKRPDLTSGSTHFYDPAAQRALGRAPPEWSSGRPLAVVGSHRFYAPQGAVAADHDDVLDRWGVVAPAATAGANWEDPFAGIPATPKNTAQRDVLDRWGVVAPAATAGANWEDPFAGIPARSRTASAVTAAPPGEVPLSTELGPMAKPVIPDALQQAPAHSQAGPVADQLADWLHRIRVATDPVAIATGVARQAAAGTEQQFSAAQAQAGRGVRDILSSQPATGFGELAAGTGGMLFSPLSGAIQAGVEQPVAALAGPEAGERAGLLASLAAPGLPAGKAVAGMAPSNRAANALVQAIGPENVPGALARLRSNPDLALMDVSPGVRKMAQGLIASPEAPTAQRVLEEAVAARQAARTGTIRTAYDETLGPAPNIRNIVDSLAEAAQRKGREAIQPAIAGAKPVDVSPVVAAIDAEVRPGLQAMLNPASQLPLSPRQEELLRLRNQLVNPETGEILTDASRLHEIQSRNGKAAVQFQSSPDGWSRQVGAGLRDVNEKLVDAIDAASGGAYRPARAQFKDAKDVEQAFADGFDTMKTRASLEGALEDTPDALKAWMKDATSEQVAARQLGVRAYVAHEMGRMRNEALAGQNVTASDYSKDKLRILFGQKEGDKLVQSIEDTKLQADTNAKLIAGSKTAETQAAERGLAIRPVQPLRFQSVTSALLPSFAAELGSHWAGLPPLIAGPALLTAGAALGGARKTASVLANRMDVARNVEIARQASATGQARSTVMNALAVHPAVIRARGGMQVP